MGGPEQQIQDVPNTQEQAQDTQEQQKTPEQEISDKVDTLSGKILSLASIYGNGNNEPAIKFEESDGSKTKITIDKNGRQTTFSLTNENGDEFKSYAIRINSEGKLSFNGKDIPNEKTQAFLDKIEAKIGDFKEYQADIKLIERQKETNDRKSDKQEADALLASIDF